ncbi:MAG: siderophore-interacting protein [Pseudomonadota bacterium]
MTVHPEFPLQADASVPGLSYNAIQTGLRHEAQTRGLNILSDTGAGITIQLVRGLMSFAPAEGGVTVTVQATTPEWLQFLKERLVDRLEQSAPQVVQDVRWSGEDQAGQHPPNFRLARIVEISAAGPAFLRVRAQAHDLSSFQDDAIHFRLLLPGNTAGPVVWPTLAANGAVRWPKGDKVLHRPIYTVRSVDRQHGIFDFDIFLHDGGRVTEWVRRAAPGEQFGLIGPSGGGIPETNRIFAFADETAFPALARILDTLPPETTGQVALLAQDGDRCGYPIQAPPGVSLIWHRRDYGVSLADLALAADPVSTGHFLWFACEKSDVLRVRAAYKARRGDASQSYIAAYWSQS